MRNSMRKICVMRNHFTRILADITRNKHNAKPKKKALISFKNQGFILLNRYMLI